MLIQVSTEFHVDLNTVTNDGWTAFFAACVQQKLTVVELMLDNAKFFKLELMTKKINGSTGYQFAKRHGFTDIVHLIEKKLPSIAL